MEPIVFDNKIIVFSLQDNFTRISPSKLFEEYVNKLITDGHPNLTIFNLSERFDETFPVPVVELGWPERLAPSLEKLCGLCKAIDSWLNIGEHNVALIYSKKDLGRSALAIGVLLVYVDISGQRDTTVFDFEAVSYYYHHNLEPYLLTSQKRYINYFKSLLSGETKINIKQQFYLNSVVIHGIPNFNGHGYCKPFIKIYQGLHLVHCSHILDIDADYVQANNLITFSIVPALKLRGDILVKCYHHPESAIQGDKSVMFAFQFHTSTLTGDQLKLAKDELDIAQADKRFPSDTMVELMFNEHKMAPRVTMTLPDEQRQMVKANSYENFLAQDILNNNNNLEVEYTKGPIDGSLYATIPKRTTTTQQISLITTTKADVIKGDDGTLDQLLNDIFYEIQAFPEVEQYDNVDGEEKKVVDVETQPTSNGETLDIAQQQQQLVESVVSAKEEVEIETNDNNNLATDLTWLQRQQLKLKHKHDQVHHKRVVVERKLFEELKQTIQINTSTFEENNNRIEQCPQSPVAPTRMSSKLLAPLVVLPSGEDTIKSLVSSSANSIEDSVDGPVLRTNRSTIAPRSSTPSFPVTNFSLNYTEAEDSPPAAYFIKDTSAFWYKPNLSREEAVRLLRNQPAGAFIIRDSNSFQGAFGLAVKVADNSVDPKVMVNGTELDHTDLVRHFLIESTPKGVQIKGCPEEPVFSSLAALVYQHSLTRISLPTRLVIPSHELEGADSGNNTTDSELLKIYENGAMCQLLYFTTKEVESLTGPNAIKKVVDELFESSHEAHLHPSPVHFKASTKGITLTDNSHRLFFRQHYPLSAISYFEFDPGQRNFHYRKDNFKISSELFGFVAEKKGAIGENECLIFGHYEHDQPAHAVIDFVNKLLKL